MVSKYSVFYSFYLLMQNLNRAGLWEETASKIDSKKNLHLYLLAEVVSGFDFLTGGDFALSLSLEESISTTGFDLPLLVAVDFEESRLFTEIVRFLALLVHFWISASDNRCTINLISLKLSLPGFFTAVAPVGCFAGCCLTGSFFLISFFSVGRFGLAKKMMKKVLFEILTDCILLFIWKPCNLLSWRPKYHGLLNNRRINCISWLLKPWNAYKILFRFQNNYS